MHALHWSSSPAQLNPKIFASSITLCRSTSCTLYFRQITSSSQLDDSANAYFQKIGQITPVKCGPDALNSFKLRHQHRKQPTREEDCLYVISLQDRLNQSSKCGEPQAHKNLLRQCETQYIENNGCISIRSCEGPQ